MPIGYPTGKYGPLTRKLVAEVTCRHLGHRLARRGGGRSCDWVGRV